MASAASTLNRILIYSKSPASKFQRPQEEGNPISATRSDTPWYLCASFWTPDGAEIKTTGFAQFRSGSIYAQVAEPLLPGQQLQGIFQEPDFVVAVGTNVRLCCSLEVAKIELVSSPVGFNVTCRIVDYVIVPLYRNGPWAT